MLDECRMRELGGMECGTWIARKYFDNLRMHADPDSGTDVSEEKHKD